MNTSAIDKENGVCKKTKSDKPTSTDSSGENEKRVKKKNLSISVPGKWVKESRSKLFTNLFMMRLVMAIFKPVC